MADRRESRTFWMLWLAGIIGLGVLSRVIHSGWAVWDKYLGDALYAAMIYVILRLIWQAAAVAMPAMVLMTAIELFQLTMIPAGMLGSEHLVVRVIARLLGTEFSFLDLLAYVVGIGFVWMVDRRRRA